MEFDVNKVFVSLSADDVKIGSRGYCSDSLTDLKIRVEHEDELAYGEVIKIHGKDCLYRFRIDNIIDKAFFYLVEEPKEKKFHPYKDTDEMIEDFKRRYSSYGGWSGNDNPMYNPMIWVKSKRTGNQRLITVLNSDNNCVRLSSISVELRELFEDYVYLDGTPCGIEEDKK